MKTEIKLEGLEKDQVNRVIEELVRIFAYPFNDNKIEMGKHFDPRGIIGETNESYSLNLLITSLLLEELNAFYTSLNKFRILRILEPSEYYNCGSFSIFEFLNLLEKAEPNYQSEARAFAYALRLCDDGLWKLGIYYGRKDKKLIILLEDDERGAFEPSQELENTVRELESNFGPKIHKYIEYLEQRQSMMIEKIEKAALGFVATYTSQRIIQALENTNYRC